MFSEKNIKKYLSSPAEVFFFKSIDSTNNYAKEIFKKTPRDFVVAANEQTAGRGRQGKSFYSPKGTGIYFTCAVHSDKNAEDTVFITTAAAVAVCRAIEKLTDATPEIKWVNDIYLNGRKICGILCEKVSGGIVIGIGININTDAFPKDVENAGALNRKVNRSQLTADIADEIFNIFNFGSDFMSEYRSRSMITGNEIIYVENGIRINALALDIDDSGGLVVKHPDGSIKTLRSGEITVRKVKSKEN